MRVEIKNRLLKVADELQKTAHDEPDVDRLLNRVDTLLATTHQLLDQVKEAQQASQYEEAASFADRSAQAIKSMSDLLLKASILLKQRASKS